MRRLNIGCGPYLAPQAEGWINLDANPRHHPDIVRDVRRGLPFDDSTCDEVAASHFLEHLPHDDMIWLLGEIYRVLRPGGVLSIVVPLGNTGELDHKMQFTAESFDCLVRPETSDYFGVPMQWEWAVPREAKTEPTRPHVDSLHVKLRAVK